MSELTDEIWRDIFPRFWSKVDVLKKNQCWEWRASLNPQGYGQISVKNKPMLAHFISYKYFNLEFKKKRGFCIDHTCMNRRCVNPNHLRYVTHKVNCLENSNSISAQNKQKTHCKNGHKFSKDNMIKLKSGWRKCRICNQNDSKKHRQTKQKLEKMRKGR